jgi:IS5 family transposase
VDSGLVHTVVTTAANEADVEVVNELLTGKEKIVHADAGYTGADKRVTRKKLKWAIAARRGKLNAMPDGRKKQRLLAAEKAKASIRARVEHPFRVIKRQFGYAKVRFRGLVKNTAQVLTLFALSNLWMARKQLLGSTGKLSPKYA